MTVSERFSTFLSNLTLTETQRDSGRTAYRSVRSCLNQHYYGSSSDSANSQLVGSWAKCTEVRPPRDVDVMFILPNSVFERYQYSYYNKQSAILSEVKGALEEAFPRTDIKSGAPAVLVPFSGYNIEVVPVFRQYTGMYNVCLTANGGSYKSFAPDSEAKHIQDANDNSKGNARDLIRMLKRWQDYCSVPMRSFWLELLAVNFLATWQYRGNSTVYYDYMMRDFFAWLTTKGESQYNTLSVPGTYETMSIGNSWASKAESAKGRAAKATEYESPYPTLAGGEWQKIFGDLIPLS